ncbi:hypothetical protein [Sphingopyxis sp. USTB-05]|uniref:hypothetical protein n=1 Tax=Sphingopyxis sp. USTB-05 TaxID=2830667 RepID=UPI002078BD8D|nr:hypothetical protein [Sphingopyxis sp. USTB-05]USI79099.1 hypothetical protein KEC45_09505 [Sphingopyxis sp. USTB-05]
MIKQLKQAMALMDPASSFDFFRIAADIRKEVDKRLNGGIDREEFERQLFQFPDMAQLPIGHLFDHRVRMPEQQARTLLAGDEAALREVLSQMLCNPHEQGAEIVAEALKLDPSEDAHRFVDFHRSYPNLAINCLTGHHEAALAISLLTPKLDIPKFNHLLVSTAIYYGALQLQIVSARQRGIEIFQFGEEEDEKGRSMGAVVDNFALIGAGLEKAFDGVFSDKKLKGRPLEIISQLREFGETFEKEAYVKRLGLSEADLLHELRTFYGYLSPRIDLIRSCMNRAKPKPAFKDHDPKNARLRSEMRAFVTTAVAGGVTGGEQIAFAGLRLLSFSRLLPNIVSGRTRWPKRHERWFGPLAGFQNKDAAKLILVARSAVWITSQYPPAFSPEGHPYDLRGSFELHTKKGNVPGQDLIKATKKKASAWIVPDHVASATADLGGAQQWDIQPEFYLGSAAPIGPAASKSSMHLGLGRSHIPSPLYSAPRKSHHLY